MKAELISFELNTSQAVSALKRSTMRFISAIAWERPKQSPIHATILGMTCRYPEWVMRSVSGKPTIYSCARNIDMSSQNGSGSVKILGLRKNIRKMTAAKKSTAVRNFLRPGWSVILRFIEPET